MKFPPWLHKWWFSVSSSVPHDHWIIRNPINLMLCSSHDHRDPGLVIIISSRMGNSWPNNPAHLDPIPTILNHHLLIITNTQRCVSRRRVNSLNPSSPATDAQQQDGTKRLKLRGIRHEASFCADILLIAGVMLPDQLLSYLTRHGVGSAPIPIMISGIKTWPKSQQSWFNHQHVAALSLSVSDKADLGHFLNRNELLSVIQLNSKSFSE